MDKSLLELKGIGQKKAKLFARLSLKTVNDLIAFTPVRYEDRSKVSQIADITEEGKYTFFVNIIESHKKRSRKGKQLTFFRVSDQSGELTLIFFSSPYIHNFFNQSQSYYIHGEVSFNGMEKVIFHPDFRSESSGAFAIESFYALTDGLNQRDFSKAIEQVRTEIDDLPELLPKIVIDKFDLISRAEAFSALHFPQTWAAIKAAIKRLKYEEIFNLQIALKLQKIQISSQQSKQQYPHKDYDGNSLFEFELTADQQKAIAEIIADLQSSKPMQRLLQGDVGSGKTAVAMAVANYVAICGYQAALMVPTEILAKQHFQSFQNSLTDVKIVCLTAASKNKESIYQAIENGEYDIVIGTHALIQSTVKFANLALVITDEQHRFGVGQRQALSSKANLSADVLVMSATPIPRSLSLIIYGDMSISTIKQMPSGRLTIKTHYVKKSKYQPMLDFIDQRIAAGEQAYFVAPLISESDKIDLKPAEELYRELSGYYPQWPIALIHGKMKAAEKNEIMTKFSLGEIKILVATTVIEVGVDVPQASIMVIYHSERFGLAQLHQLRGRVGRGSKQSYCFLLADNPSKIAQERIAMMVKSNDGFAIANRDLELRGPGEILGLRQHGLPDLKYVNLSDDLAAITEISEYVDYLLAEKLLPMEYIRYLEQKLAL